MTSFRILLPAIVLAVMVGMHCVSSSSLWPRRYGFRFRRLHPSSSWNSRYYESGDGNKKDAVEKPLSEFDPNVCEFKKAVARYSGCPWKKNTRRITYYNTEYKCCTGFKRVPGKAGCPEELYTSTMNIPEMATELGLNTFLKYAGKTSVSKLLSGKEKFTLFAPTDEAFAQLPQEVVEKMESLKWARYFVQYHVVEGKHIAETLKDGMNLSSYEFKDPLRVSVTDIRKTILIEGANVSKLNQGASNGVIHVIDRVLIPPRHTMMEVLKQDEGHRFTIFQKILTEASLNLIGQYTLFAPTDKAFEKLPNETLKKIIDSNGCHEALVKNHFVRGYLFSKTISPSKAMTVNTLEGSQVCIERSESDAEITIDGKAVSEEDVRATDGVIHVIDEVMLVSTALDLVSLSEHLNLTDFAKLLKTSNLVPKLEGKSHYTIFAPSNEAFDKVSDEFKQTLVQNPQLLLKVLAYHVVEGSILKKQLRNDMTLKTLNKGNQLLIKKRVGYYSWFTVEGSCVKRADIPACNGAIHIIDEVLVPPVDDLLHILDTDPRLSLFRSMMTKTSVETLLSGRDLFTVFAPSVDAMARLPVDKLRDILKDNVSTEAFLLRHIVRGKAYSRSLTCTRRATLNNLRNKDISFKISPIDHDFKIDDIKVNATDISAINGVIHVIDGVIPKKVIIPYWSQYRSWASRYHHRGFGSSSRFFHRYRGLGMSTPRFFRRYRGFGSSTPFVPWD